MTKKKKAKRLDSKNSSNKNMKSKGDVSTSKKKDKKARKK